VLLGRLPSLSVQELSEALLSAAVMQLWDAPLLKAVYRRLEKAYSADVATWSTRNTFDVFDFYSAYLAAAAERPGLLPAPRRSVLGAARAAARQMMAPDPATEGMRGDMAACLEQLGVDYAAVVWCERSETRVDFALPSGAGAQGAPGVAPAAPPRARGAHAAAAGAHAPAPAPAAGARLARRRGCSRRLGGAAHVGAPGGPAAPRACRRQC
jgi:hypothetical protein